MLQQLLNVANFGWVTYAPAIKNVVNFGWVTYAPAIIKCD